MYTVKHVKIFRFIFLFGRLRSGKTEGFNNFTKDIQDLRSS
jgi:AAA+ ATPase superfamily predicted ATPase